MMSNIQDKIQIKVFMNKMIELISHLKEKLDNYTQKKADFLAELTTEPLASSKSLYFYKEVILPFIENTLLMDNLGANEGVRYQTYTKNRLILRVFIDGKEIYAKYEEGEQGNIAYYYPAVPVCDESPNHISGLPYILHHISAGVTDQNKIFRPLAAFVLGTDDVEIDLPGPLGEHAIYSFLENFIRNSAKHNKEQLEKQETEKNLEINLCLSNIQGDDQHYCLRIWDNYTKASKDVKSTEGSVELIMKLNTYRSQSIIGDDGNLIREAWGLMEMKICALLLSGKKNYSLLGPQESGNIEKQKQLLGIERIKECKGLEDCKECQPNDDSLVFQLRIMKTKNICALTHKNLDNRKAGIYWYKDVVDLLKILWSTKDIDSFGAFKFAVFDYDILANAINSHVFSTTENKDSDKPTFDRFLSMLPFRIIILNDNKNTCADINNLVLQKRAIIVEEGYWPENDWNSYCLIAWAWRTWVNGYFLSNKEEKRKVSLQIYLQQQETESPTKKWIELAKKNYAEENSVNFTIWGDRNEQPTCLEGELFDHLQDKDFILYDRHGYLPGSLPSKGIENFQSYVLLDKRSSDFTPIFNPSFPLINEESHWAFPFELAEAGLLRILVIDERVAERAYDELDEEYQKKVLTNLFGIDKTLRFHAAHLAKIYICTDWRINGETHPLHSTIQLKRESKNPEANNLPSLCFAINNNQLLLELKTEAKIDSETKATIEYLSADLIVIHQGVIEMWGRNETIKAWFNQQKILDIIRNKIPFIVINSGRGIPPNLKNDVKFLPFSLVQDFLLGSRISKYSFSKLCMSLTRQKQDS